LDAYCSNISIDIRATPETRNVKTSKLIVRFLDMKTRPSQIWANGALAFRSDLKVLRSSFLGLGVSAADVLLFPDLELLVLGMARTIKVDTRVIANPNNSGVQISFIISREPIGGPTTSGTSEIACSWKKIVALINDWD
jgi:hypothetical protein